MRWLRDWLLGGRHDDAPQLDCGCRSLMVHMCGLCGWAACQAHYLPHECGVAVQRAIPWAAGHPADCSDRCCFERRLDEKTAAFDWAAAEADLTNQ